MVSWRTHHRVIEEYKKESGQVPFRKWLNELTKSNPAAAQRIDARLARVKTGNLGEHRGVGEGVKELVLNFGPGYRLYFAEDGDSIVVLLFGGTKKGQSRDIEQAKAYWKSYKELKNENKKNKRTKK